MSENKEKNGAKPGRENQGAFPTLSGMELVEEIGTQIGPYKLLSVLGEGGFGIVYRAEQKKPVRRQVALKVIKPGMDSKQVIGRFEAERQALALLDHPNIARVFDAGTTENGRPYFVMEYVKGVPLTEHCDRKKLDTEQRLQLFLHVCEAIQHAHQKGIIHRDIKPSNILVSMQGDKAEPKIIDFGVAKAIGQPLTERTLFTAQGQLIGTPEYMSPEQAELTSQDIDTRSDIYSLGVLLYELLTGVLPFDPETLHEAAFDEILRIIRDEDPPRPSTRLLDMGDEATPIAASHRTDVRTLAKRLHKELEWIPLKAMRKERDRRYKTASELADDIRNYLNGDALIAGPESVTYRVKKFARKHTGPIASVAAVLTALIIGLAISTMMYVVAEETRKKEAAARAEAECALYFNRIHLADKELADGGFYRAQELLTLCPSELRRWEWYHLWHILSSTGTPGFRNARPLVWPSFSPDGNHIAGGYKNAVVILDTETGAEVLAMSGHEGPVTSVAYSPDGKTIVSGSDDKTVRLWDVTAKSLVATLSGHEMKVTCVAFSPDGRRIASGCWDGTVIVWDAKTGRDETIFRGHSWGTFRVAFAPDGASVISGEKEGVVKIWEAATGREAVSFSIPGYSDDFSDMAFSPDGNHVAAPVASGIGIWNVITGDKVSTIEVPSWVTGAWFSPDGKHVVSSHFDRRIRVWDVGRSAEVLSIHGHHDMVVFAQFSPDGRCIISEDFSGRIGIWRFEKEDVARLLTIDPWSSLSIGSMAFDADGKCILLVGAEGLIGISNMAGQTEIKSLGWYSYATNCSADGKHVVQGWIGTTIKIWDISKGVETRNFPVDELGIGIQAVAFSPDGERILIGGETTVMPLNGGPGRTTRKIAVLDAATGEAILTFDTRARPEHVAFSPDGKHIVSAGVHDVVAADGMIEVWDVIGRTKTLELRSKHVVLTVAFSKDGRHIASGDLNGEVAIWDCETGTKLQACNHGATVTGVDFGPDGKRIVSSGWNQVVKVWDTATGIEVLSLDVPSSVVAVAFSPDGKHVVAGFADGTIKAWDSTSPNELADPGSGKERELMHYDKNKHEVRLPTSKVR